MIKFKIQLFLLITLVLGALTLAVAQTSDHNQRMNALSLSQNVRDAFSKRTREFEAGAKGALSAVDASIAKAEQALKTSLTTWINKTAVVARARGSNRTFCAVLRSQTAAAKARLVSAMSSESDGDTVGVRRARSNLHSSLARSTTGYRLCGYEPDAALEGLQKAAAHIDEIYLRQDVGANIKKACALSIVQGWPALKKACASGQHSEEMIHTLSLAINGKYSEESQP